MRLAENYRLKPFVFAGVGAAFFSAEDLETETKLSWDVEGGIKWFPTKWLGARLCDPFGFCQNSLNQFEIMGGVVFQF